MTKNLLIIFLVALLPVVKAAEQFNDHLILDLPLKNSTQPGAMSSITNLTIYSDTVGFSSEGYSIFTESDFLRIVGDKLMFKEFTISMWLKHTPSDRYGKSSIFRLPGGNGHDFGGRMWSERRSGTAVLHWGMRTKESGIGLTIGSIFDSKYYFVALVVAPEGMKAYINGELAAERQTNSEIQYGKGDFILNLGSCHFPNLQGSIGDFRIYDVCLDEKNIEKLYLEQKKLYTEKVLPVAQSKITQDSNLKFYPTDDLQVVTGSDTSNLLPNPSFETGLGYWKGLVAGPSLKPFHAGISDKHAASGKYSAILQGWKGERETRLDSFAIEVTPGETYTFSFQARADKPTSINARIVSAIWPIFPVNQNIKLDTEWKQFEFTFTAPNNIAQPSVSGPNKPDIDNKIYIDAVQLKDGKPTTFSEPPFCSELSSEKFGNIFAPGDDISATIKVFFPKQLNGRVKISGYDFEKRELFNNEYELINTTNGYESIPIDLSNKLVNGMNILRADFKFSNGQNYTGFYRVTILPPRTKEFDPPQFFGLGSIGCFPNAEESFKLFSKFGFGSILGFGKVHPKLLKKQYQKNGFIVMCSVFFSGGTSRYWIDEKNGSNNAIDYDVKHKYMNLTDAQFDEVMQRVSDKVKANPHIIYWKLINEIGATHVSEKNIAPFIKLCRAAAEAIRDANPKAKVLSPDQTNIYATDGLRSIEKLLKAGMGDFVDILSVHAYRPHPDATDLDSDLTKLFIVLDKYKFKGKVWITENINHTLYEIPAIGWGISDHASCDNARGASLSYDLGIGERLGSAYRARHFLISFKYASRIDVSCDWSANSSSYLLDASGTPRAMGFAINTLARLFSQMKYVEDVAISDEVRCYLFRSGTSTIAALWNRDWDIDKGKKAKTVVYLPFSPSEAEIIDLMGNPVKVPQSGRIEVGSSPMFFKSKEIDYVEFATKMKAIKQEGGQSKLLTAVETFLAPDKIKFTLTSNVNRSLSGNFLYSVNGSEVLNSQLVLPPHDTKSFDITLKKALKSGLQVKTDANFKMVSGEEFRYQQNQKLLVSKFKTEKIKIDGNLSDWKSPGIKLVNEVESFRENLPSSFKSAPETTFYSGWDDDYLYVAVEVVSPTFTPPINPPKGYWNADSLQLYFDTENDAKKTLDRTFDFNDYVYGVFASKDNSIDVIRYMVPEWQLCFLKTGLAPDVKRAFTRTKDGYIYELAFPVASLSPILLEQNRTFGFALLVNNMSGNTRLGRTLMPEAIEPYNNVNKWPTMILAK
jgi:hypothetical protein